MHLFGKPTSAGAHIAAWEPSTLPPDDDDRRPRFPLRGSFKGDVDIGIDRDVDIDVDTDLDAWGTY